MTQRKTSVRKATVEVERLEDRLTPAASPSLQSLTKLVAVPHLPNAQVHKLTQQVHKPNKVAQQVHKPNKVAQQVHKPNKVVHHAPVNKAKPAPKARVGVQTNDSGGGGGGGGGSQIPDPATFNLSDGPTLKLPDPATFQLSDRATVELDKEAENIKEYFRNIRAANDALLKKLEADLAEMERAKSGKPNQADRLVSDIIEVGGPEIQKAVNDAALKELKKIQDAAQEKLKNIFH